jgi:hypothetical protein
MKRILLCAAAAAMVLTSCMKGGEVIPPDHASIVVKFSGVKSMNSRAQEAPGNTTTAKVSADASAKHYIYVLDADNQIIHKEPLDPAQAVTGSGQPIKNGDYFLNSTKLYVMCNIPADVDPTALTEWDDILATQTDIVYTSGSEQNTGLEYPAMANADGLPEAVDGYISSGVANVEVSISPLFARIELKGVEANIPAVVPAEGKINDFTVKGIYLDKYYSSFSMTGAAKGNQNSNGSSTAQTELDKLFNDKGSWAMAAKIAKPANDPIGNFARVWAYHAAPADDVPTFLVQLDVVHSMEPAKTGGFLTVTSYNQGAGSPTTFANKFERGKIYQVNNIVFDYDDVTTNPNPSAVTLTADVTVQSWEVVYIDPVLGS